MNILDAIENAKKEQSVKKNIGSIKIEDSPELFRQLLQEAGASEDCIEDCLFEHTEKWAFLLKYFEDKKQNDKNKR